MQLRDYQLNIATQANELLCTFKVAYLAMEVRTGKTISSMYAAKLYGAKRVLFVTKLKAIGSIKKDFEQMGQPFDIYVINYESLHKCENDFDLIILDEAHCLGQYPQPSQRVKELKRICVGKPIIYLSGTPSPEGYSQLFHQFWVSSFSPWLQFKKFYDWHKEYGIPAVKFLYNRQVNDYSKTKKEAILLDVEHLMISFTQQQAGFEAFVEEEIIMLPMSDKIAKSLKIIKRDKIINTKDGSVILADTKVKEMQKVHQICSGTVKCEDSKAIVFDMTKAEYIKEKFAGKKIAIFYKYVAEGTALIYHFNDRIILDPMAFNLAGNDAVFISQIQSGREGINLSSADCLIMYNIDFSAVSYWQARARMQTKDRVAPAKVYWLFTTGGIEEKIYEKVMNKKDYTLQYYRS